MARQRESNFELLRVLAMFMIVMQHAIERGSGVESRQVLKGKYSINFVISSLQKIPSRFHG